MIKYTDIFKKIIPDYTIRVMIASCPELFPNRFEALEHLLLVIGNGWGWEDGYPIPLVGCNQKGMAALALLLKQGKEEDFKELARKMAVEANTDVSIVGDMMIMDLTADGHTPDSRIAMNRLRQAIDANIREPLLKALKIIANVTELSKDMSRIDEPWAWTSGMVYPVSEYSMLNWDEDEDAAIRASGWADIARGYWEHILKLGKSIRWDPADWDTMFQIGLRHEWDIPEGVDIDALLTPGNK